MKDTILVVEDEPDILDLVAYNLRQADYNVLPVDSGELALEKAEDNRFSAVVLDIMLPGIDGLEVCRKLKAMPEMRDDRYLPAEPPNDSTPCDDYWGPGEAPELGCGSSCRSGRESVPGCDR